MWPRHVIVLVSISNNILLSLPIAFTYYFILIILFSQYTKFHLFIIENRLFFIALLKRTNLLLHYWKMHQLVILL